MGDRANVFVKEAGVYLYTHNEGCKLPFIVQRALSKQWRWTDPPYLARVVFTEMIRGEEENEFGFGISTKIVDNEHDIIVLDPNSESIEFQDENTGEILYSWPFSEYIKLTPATLIKTYLGPKPS